MQLWNFPSIPRTPRSSVLPGEILAVSKEVPKTDFLNSVKSTVQSGESGHVKRCRLGDRERTIPSASGNGLVKLHSPSA